MNVDNLKKLLKELEEGLTSYEEAAPMVYNNENKKFFQTEEWKSFRDKHIKDSCEQCSSAKGPMVLVHLWKSRSYRDFIGDATEKILENEKKQGKFDFNEEEFDAYLSNRYKLREACPECESVSFTKRKTKPELPFRCGKCKHEFAKAITIRHITGPVTKEQIKASYISFRDNQLKRDVWKQNQDKIRKTALINSIKEYIRYMSIEGKATFCKKCAFLFNKQGMLLCEDCKAEYHPSHREQCMRCASK